jgi:hypothetical protein
MKALVDSATLAQIESEEKGVYDLYHKDGTELSGWLQAPNEKPSKLDERHWLQVRTPAFKDKFGDWEVEANAKWLINKKAITGITGEEFKKNPQKDLKTQVQEYFDSIGGEVTRDGLGKVLLEKNGIKSAIGHKIGRPKVAAFQAVPDIIKKGRTIDMQTNWKGRDYDTEVVDTVINIGTGENIKEFIAEAIINKYKNGRNTYYLHEVEEKSKLLGIVQTVMGNGGLGASRLIIAKKMETVKGKISIHIDENGEPILTSSSNNGVPSL